MVMKACEQKQEGIPHLCAGRHNKDIIKNGLHPAWGQPVRKSFERRSDVN